MELLEKTPDLLTIGEIVAQNYRAADLFDKYGIDFCCGGKQHLVEVCTQKGISFEDVLQEVKQLQEMGPSMPGLSYQLSYQQWSLDFLVDYIVQTHHNYLQEELPPLASYLRKLVSVHATRHPELVDAEQLFLTLEEELLSHLWKEENILFPYIKKMVAVQREGGTLERTFVGSPVTMMEAEHETAGDVLREIRAITQDFALPDDACTTYRVTFAKLRALEKDLHTHIHLENNILFPGSIALESKLLNPPYDYVI